MAAAATLSVALESNLHALLRQHLHPLLKISYKLPLPQSTPPKPLKTTKIAISSHPHQRAKAFRDEAAAIAAHNLDQTARARSELAEEQQRNREQARAFQRLIRCACFLFVSGLGFCC